MKNTSYFKNRNKNKKPLGKIMIVFLISLLVIVPAILAIAGYYIRSNNIIGANSLKVSLYYNGAMLGEQSDDPQNEHADELVLIFDSMRNNLKKTELKPTQLTLKNSYDVTLSTRTDTQSYKCFFNIDSNKDSYCIDEQQNVYLISTSTTEAFLSSQYSEYLYPNAYSPKMYSSLDEEITPYAHEWYYKDHLNSLRKASPIPQISTQPEYNMSGQLGLSFDVVPDKCTVKIYKSGIKIYDNDLSQLSSFSVDAGTNLQFDVSAEWDKKDESKFYGTVRYNFRVLVRDRANFIIDSTSVNTGEYAFVSCTNILDASKIKFTSEPSINCEPIFFEDNNVVRTILPISNDLDAGEYKLTFSYGASSETLLLNVNKSETPNVYNFSIENTELVSSLTNKTNTDTVTDIINKLKFDNRIFVRSKFADYKDSGAEALVKYGALITSDNGDITHTVTGTQFVWKDNKNPVVFSLNSGIVAKVGYCGYLGNYVVVDHGLGLRTVYAHLDTVFVKENQVLIKSEQIGLGGSLNAASPTGVFIMCFVYDVPINYEALADKELTFYYPEIKEEE